MFVKKTQAEIDAMNPEDAQKYFDAKEAADKAATQDLINSAVKTATEGLVTKEEAKTATDEAVKTATKELAETVEEQGKSLAKITTHKGAEQKDTLEVAFKEKYDAVVGGAEHIVKTEDKIVIDCKAIISTDIMSVNTVSAGAFPTAGSTGVVGSVVNTIYAKVIGFFGVRELRSSIMDRVTIEPMESATLIAINETYTGNAEITPECTLKPIVKMTFDTQSVDADPVAAMWFTTTKLRRFFANLVNRMETKFAELVNLRIPDAVNTYIAANGTAFTPIPQLIIPGVVPNNYDAVGAMIASLQALGWEPNEIRMNPIAWRNMKQDKTAEGVYTLSNGQSISLVDRGIDWGGRMIPIMLDPTMGYDEVIVGDMTKVIVGLDSELMYYETDGRTDAQATNAVTGLAKNIRTHVLEKFLAVIIPNGNKPAIMRDTFSNVKTLITEETP